MTGPDVKLKLPGLFADKRPSGSTRYRVRVEKRKWEKITLPVGPEHPSFMEHYLAARAGRRPDHSPPVDQVRDVIPHSVSWLTLRFEAWMESRVQARLLDPGTLKQRRAYYDRIRAEHGTKRMDMPKSKLLEFRDTMIDTPGAANNMVKAVRACYSWAVERDLVAENPALGIDNLKSGQGAVPWSIDDLRQYRERHPIGTMAHLALTLFMFTACRIGDGYRLGRQNEAVVQGIRRLQWQPEKRGSALVDIPLLPPLERAISAMTVLGPTYLLTVHGQPFRSKNAFGNKFRDWVEEADLKNRSTHGIRKAAGELLALEGASQYHIMAIHGHTQAKTSEVYTSGVNRQRLATEAMKLLAHMDW